MALTEKNYWVTPDTKGRDLRFPKGPHPRGFTGKKGDRHYYMGQVVTGPSALAGCKDQAKIDAWYANRGRTAPEAAQ